MQFFFKVTVMGAFFPIYKLWVSLQKKFAENWHSIVKLFFLSDMCNNASFEKRKMKISQFQAFENHDSTGTETTLVDV